MRARRMTQGWLCCLLITLVSCITACFDAGDEASSRDTGAVSADTDDAVNWDSGDGAADVIDPPGDTSTDVGDDDDVQRCDEGFSECGAGCVDLMSSLEHCGTCGRRCEARAPHTVAQCIDSSCEIACEAGFVDADGDSDNGCELACEPSNGGVETCDGRDNDCDGLVDEDDADNASTWYADADGDGFGDAQVEARACNKPEGFVDNTDDCDDTEAEVYAELGGFADQDGDGFTVGEAQSFCTDGSLPEGFVALQNGEDCDDTDDQIHPSADEVCDGADNNCDGRNNEPGASGATVWYVDCDGDGYAANTAGSRTRCERPSTPPNGCETSNPGWTDRRPSGGGTTDCNDDESLMHPGQRQWFDTPLRPASVATEDWDYNCDGQVTRRYTVTEAACDLTPINNRYCRGSSGWKGESVMFCGQSADYQNCSMCRGCSSCDASVVSKTQECR